MCILADEVGGGGRGSRGYIGKSGEGFSSRPFDRNIVLL